MHKSIRTAAALLLTLTLGNAAAEISACAQNDDNRGIADAYEQRLRDAVRAKTGGDVSDLYAESAILMPPTDETLVGRGPIATYLTSRRVPLTDPRYNFDLVSCRMSGDTLHITGVWGVPGDAGGAKQPTTWMSGNLMRVLKPTPDGSWVSAYEIWN